MNPNSDAPQNTVTSSGPLVSVVMPCYREPLDVLGRTIDSILGQTYRNIEFIVVVDDPTRVEMLDYLKERSAADPRLQVFPNPVNLGVWPSYNNGVRRANGEYIAIQDADDVSLPTRLERLLEYMLSHPNVDVVGCGLEYIDSDSGTLLMTRSYPAAVDGEIQKRCPLAHATTMRRAGLYEAYGFYNESPVFQHAADYELWCRWLAAGVRMANIPEILYLYYQSSQNFKTQNVRAILRDTIAVKRAYIKQLQFRPVDRIYLFAETVASHLPPRTITALFYAITRRRNRRSDKDISRIDARP